MGASIQDIRYAVRLLMKRPGFTLIAVLALALGVGANSAIFSVVNAVLLKPLPYTEADRLVWFWEVQPKLDRAPFSPADFLDYQAQNNSFEEITTMRPLGFSLTGIDQPEQLRGAIVSANFFSVLRAEPQRGRVFLPDDGNAGAARVAVISHGLWQNRFGGDPELIGKTITLNSESVTIIGILPPGFKFQRQADVWVNPRQIVPEPFSTFTDDVLSMRGTHYLWVFGRLKKDVTLQQAQADINTVVARLQQQHDSDHSVSLISLQAQSAGDMKPALIVLMAAVGLVLLIACANVANLMLARATARTREIAIRTALGASRARVVQQLLTESLLLAVMGGAAGLVLAWWGVDLLVSVSPPDTPRLDMIGLDRRVFLFNLAISLATGVIFGLVPALQASKPDLNEALKEGGRSGSDSARRNRVRSLLVIAEVALSMVVLIGAGLLIKSFVRLLDVNSGFNTANLMTAGVSLPGKKYDDNKKIIRFYDELVQRLESLPGVDGVAVANDLPLQGDDTTSYATIEDQQTGKADDHFLIGRHVINTGYFKAMGIQLMSGREFTATDVDGTPSVIIINQTAAHRLWPDEDPIGKRLRFGDSPTPWSQVVGVVADVKHNGLDAEPSIESYVPFAQGPYPYMAIALRAANPTSYTAAIRREVQAIDKDQPLYDFETMAHILSESIAPRRLSMVLFALFAGVAVLLAGVGIYGVMSYSVTQRTHEIGVRMALGAKQKDVLRMIVGQGIRLALVGVGIGLVAAFGLTRLMTSLLFGVNATDPVTFIAISLLLTGVALAACYVPARRATQVDPMVALRYE